MNALPQVKLLAAILSTLLPACAYAQQAKKTEDAAAGKAHAARGSQKEKEAFEKRALPASPPAVDAGKTALPAGAEVREKLGKAERPSVRFLKQGKAKPKVKKGGFGLMGMSAPAQVEEKPEFPQHKNKLENPDIRLPKDFEIEYSLDADADVSVSVITLDGAPVGGMEFTAGKPGGKAGANKRPVWNGQDFAGRELPTGQYTAVLDITYTHQEPAQKARRYVPLPKK